jgi:hypothetical protein
MADPKESQADQMKRIFQPRPGEDAAEQFMRIFKDQMREVLALRLPDDLFQPGREQELERSIEQIVDMRLTADKVPIGRQLRIRLIESLMADVARASKERFGKN